MRVLDLRIMKGMRSRCPQRQERLFFWAGMLLSQTSMTATKKAMRAMVSWRQVVVMVWMTAMQELQVTAWVNWQILNMQISILSSSTKSSCLKQSPWYLEAFLVMYCMLRSSRAVRTFLWKKFMEMRMPPSRMLSVISLRHLLFSKGVRNSALSLQTLLTRELTKFCWQLGSQLLKMVVSLLATLLNLVSVWLRVTMSLLQRDWLMQRSALREQAARRSKQFQSSRFSDLIRSLTSRMTVSELGKKSRIWEVAMKLRALRRQKTRKMKIHLQQFSQLMNLIFVELVLLSFLWKRSQVSISKISSSWRSMVLSLSGSTILLARRAQQSFILSRQWVGMQLRKVKLLMSWLKRNLKQVFMVRESTSDSRKYTTIDIIVKQPRIMCCRYEMFSQSFKKNSFRLYISGKLLNSQYSKVLLTSVWLRAFMRSNSLNSRADRQCMFCRNWWVSTFVSRLFIIQKVGFSRQAQSLSLVSSVTLVISLAKLSSLSEQTQLLTSLADQRVEANSWWEVLRSWDLRMQVQLQLISVVCMMSLWAPSAKKMPSISSSICLQQQKDTKLMTESRRRMVSIMTLNVLRRLSEMVEGCCTNTMNFSMVLAMGQFSFSFMLVRLELALCSMSSWSLSSSFSKSLSSESAASKSSSSLEFQLLRYICVLSMQLAVWCLSTFLASFMQITKKPILPIPYCFIVNYTQYFYWQMLSSRQWKPSLISFREPSLNLMFISSRQASTSLYKPFRLRNILRQTLPSVKVFFESKVPHCSMSSSALIRFAGSPRILRNFLPSPSILRLGLRTRQSASLSLKMLVMKCMLLSLMQILRQMSAEKQYCSLCTQQISLSLPMVRQVPDLAHPAMMSSCSSAMNCGIRLLMLTPMILLVGKPNMSSTFLVAAVMMPMVLVSTRVSMTQERLWQMNFLNSFREQSSSSLQPKQSSLRFSLISLPLLRKLTLMKQKSRSRLNSLLFLNRTLFCSKISISLAMFLSDKLQLCSSSLILHSPLERYFHCLVLISISDLVMFSISTLISSSVNMCSESTALISQFFLSMKAATCWARQYLQQRWMRERLRWEEQQLSLASISGQYLKTTILKQRVEMRMEMELWKLSLICWISHLTYYLMKQPSWNSLLLHEHPASLQTIMCFFFRLIRIMLSSSFSTFVISSHSRSRYSRASSSLLRSAALDRNIFLFLRETQALRAEYSSRVMMTSKNSRFAEMICMLRRQKRRTRRLVLSSRKQNREETFCEKGLRQYCMKTRYSKQQRSY